MRRRRAGAAALLAALVVGILGLAGGSSYLWYEKETRDPPHPAHDSVTVVIPVNASVSRIAAILHDARLIDSELAFQIYVRMDDAAAHLQAGTFTLSHSMNLRQIVAALERAPKAPYRQITVIEGWTAGLIAQRVQQLGIGSAHDYLSAAASGPYDEGFLEGLPAGTSLEGYLFPDTYELALDATPGDLVRKQLTRFDQELTPDLRADAASRGRSIRDVVIMASIVQREAARPQDMAQVAQVLWRRIDLGMPLQADATVLYAEGVWKKQVLDEDLAFQSPYNTYLHPGLPPGPISNPGLQALKAAINPAPGDYLYYLSDPSGAMHFSHTEQEHDALKQQYYPNG